MLFTPRFFIPLLLVEKLSIYFQKEYSIIHLQDYPELLIKGKCCLNAALQISSIPDIQGMEISNFSKEKDSHFN